MTRSDRPSFPPPIAIGGLGGSGTRVFAQILEAAGFYMGDHNNISNDNLWFTILFKRRTWTESVIEDGEISQAIDLFYRAMTIGLKSRLSDEERTLISNLHADLQPQGTWICGAMQSDMETLMNSEGLAGSTDRHWGWKEPNTHVFLPQLQERIPDFRFIYVVRNGLDMAYSRTTWQTRHWRHLFPGCEETDAPLPVQQLRFWLAANRRILDRAKIQGEQKILILNYDAFCDKPAQQWKRLIRFIGVPDNHALAPEQFIRPTSIGRSTQHDLNIFPQADLIAAETMQEELNALIK